MSIGAAGLSREMVGHNFVSEDHKQGPNFQDRIERNYEAAVRQDGVVEFWRRLCDFFPQYGLRPINEITSVGTVYFDNKDYDLTRYTVLNPARRMLVRLRTYETFGELPKPISDYWIEVKIKIKGQWIKKRVRLMRADLPGFLAGQDAAPSVLEDSQNGGEPEVIRRLYREIQELILTMGLEPFFLLTYKRLAFQNDVERISLDWDNQYYSVGSEVYSYDSWKYPVVEPIGKSEKTILELKYPLGAQPIWVSALENKFPIFETGFLKFVEGMGFFFQGPLKNYRESGYFLRLINAYRGESRLAR